MRKDVAQPSTSRTHPPRVRTGKALLAIALALLFKLAGPTAVEGRSTPLPQAASSNNTSTAIAPLVAVDHSISVSNLALSPDGLLAADMSDRKHRSLRHSAIRPVVSMGSTQLDLPPLVSYGSGRACPARTLHSLQ